MTGNGRILSADYDELTMDERVNAIRAAEEEGDFFARSDEDGIFAEESGVVAQATAQDYFVTIVKPCWQADICTDTMFEQWKCELLRDRSVHDPRVATFIHAVMKTRQNLADELAA